MTVPRIFHQRHLIHPARRAASGFGSGRLDRQAKSICSLAGFLKVLAACWKGPVENPSSDGVAIVSEFVIDVLGIDGCNTRHRRVSALNPQR
jgi:hypothetical protein